MGQSDVQTEIDQEMDKKLLGAIRYYIKDIIAPNLTDEEIFKRSAKKWIDDFCDSTKLALERMESKIKDITAKYR